MILINLNIFTDIYDSLDKFFNSVGDFFEQIIEFLNFIIDSIGIIGSLLYYSVHALSSVVLLSPAFLSIFFTLYSLILITRLLMQLV